MSINMQPTFLTAFNRAVEETRRKIEAAIEATGNTGGAMTNNNSVVLRVTTTGDSAVRGGTLTFNWVESASPGGLSPTAGHEYSTV